MYHTGALESELVAGTNPFQHREKIPIGAADERSFHNALDRSMQLAGARLRENPRDADALYGLGVAYGLRANYSFLVKKAWIDSLRDATEARKLHNRVTAIDPSRIDARLIQGLHDYVIGSLPWHYRVLGFIAGFHGDKETGIRTLQEVAARGEINCVDAKVLLAGMYRREHRPGDAVPLLQELLRDYPRNHLFRFELVQMYSDMGDKQRALAELATIRRLKGEGAAGYADVPPAKIDYSEGNLRFWYGDLEQARSDFRRVTAAADALDLNTALLAWMRLGQADDLLGDRDQARSAYPNAIALAPKSALAAESRGYLAKPYHRKAADARRT